LDEPYHKGFFKRLKKTLKITSTKAQGWINIDADNKREKVNTKKVAD
jgi:hypothetical protein